MFYKPKTYTISKFLLFCALCAFSLAITGCVEETVEVIFIPVKEEGGGCIGGIMLIWILAAIGMATCDSFKKCGSPSQGVQQQMSAPTAPSASAPAAAPPAAAADTIETPEVDAQPTVPAVEPLAPAGNKVIIASTHNQVIPPGTMIQVLIYDNDLNEWREVNAAHVNYHDYQLEIELVEAIPDGTRWRVNWFLPQNEQAESPVDSYGNHRFIHRPPFIPMPRDERGWSHGPMPRDDERRFHRPDYRDEERWSHRDFHDRMR
jgi:hypothetical protein